MWRERLTGLMAVLLLGMAGQASALCNCYLPESPSIPDGQTASNEQIQFARNKLVGYQEKMQSYKQCLEGCIADAADTENAVVQQWNQTVESFNSRVVNP
ncbi:MAG: hypothetical protein ACPH3N_05095 [Alcanivorax sediminis]|uniref:Secreted protein n=1 Tax=Alcanivorax sediminis TaxID=2663008 RepID=A0A6N7LWG2_9GAMM|nr:hypothetical protein [Alcanivorax sediminis]MQX52571.1 hypothetical protein [Alcanivorax sediminis]